MIQLERVHHSSFQFTEKSRNKKFKYPKKILKNSKEKMKIICAGYNRTGTKSCSRALEILGYKVADLYETAEYLRFVKWCASSR